ncbi:MAG: hypothetical protein JXA20_00155 [Spirochaetes bacterium]|nr:hypothetical protein [Spirochaetota bacterium]
MRIHGRMHSLLMPAALIVVCFLSTCGSTSSESVREETILNRATKEKSDVYAAFLVDPSQYTTRGGDFQKTYYRHLIGIAGEIIEKRKLTIVRGSIGFYYDKKSGDKNRLYLGVDIDSGRSYPGSLTVNAMKLLRRDVGIVVHTMNSCRSIFSEKEVVGMVIGWKWSGSAGPDYVSLWIDKGDVMKYESRQLTVEEVIHRSTVTSSSGKVIRLPL